MDLQLLQRERVADFLKVNQGMRLLSTSAHLVDITADVYNVSGSSKDPRIDGKSWKELLIDNGINDDCYVTKPEAPPSSSHPKFSVGGHMTLNKDGHVENGADSYLMPLCSWHNHTSRDHIPFEHKKTLMLRLEGYMQADLAITFMARMADERDHATRMIFQTNLGWEQKAMRDDEAVSFAANPSFVSEDESEASAYFTLKREPSDGSFYIDFISNDLMG